MDTIICQFQQLKHTSILCLFIKDKGLINAHRTAKIQIRKTVVLP